jgi:hypothetical protein
MPLLLRNVALSSVGGRSSKVKYATFRPGSGQEVTSFAESMDAAPCVRCKHKAKSK